MRPYAFTLALGFALACAWLPATADNAFSVKAVHVDASAASASEAQLAALAQGRPRAWATLSHRLTRVQDWPRLPTLDDTQLQRLIRGFEVANERRSTTRYVADITYNFSPDAVARVLQTASIAYTQMQAKRILLIPMAPGYARGSPWTAALANPRFAGSIVPFALPVGDALDQSALGGLGFEQASWADVEPVASRVRATQAVLALATQAGGRLTIVLRRLGTGELPSKASLDVPLAQGGVQSTYSAAADATVHAIEEMWKKSSAVDFSQRARLTASVHISSLGQWGNLQNALVAVPNVAGVSVIAMDIGQARIAIAYLGTADQLREALAAQGISLTKSGGDWTVAAAPSANAP